MSAKSKSRAGLTTAAASSAAAGTSMKRFVVIAAIFLASCGAPLKKADEVSTIFSDSMQLNEKLSALCGELRTRPESPNLVGIGLADDVCGKPGSRALSYPALNGSLGFTVVEGQSSTNDATKDSIFTIRTRSEVWLNKGLISLVSSLVGKLKSETDALMSKGGSASAYNEKFAFKVVGKPQFDMEKMELNLDISIVSTKAQNGQVNVDNNIKVRGKLFDQKYFVALAETTESSPVAKSLIESAKFLITVVPHAGDVYVDITTDVRLHSFGVDSTMKQQMVEMLGPGLLNIVDLLAKIE
jgi:hypothetical protein